MSDTTRAWPSGAPEVGQTAQRTRTVTQRDIELFTEMSGDRNPLHYDEELAAQVWRDHRAGWCHQRDPECGGRRGFARAGFGISEHPVELQGPVRPGDEITGSVEVTNVRLDKPITNLRTTVALQDGTVVLEGDAVCYTMPL